MTTIAKLSENIVSEEKILKIAKEKPDLLYEFIRPILIGQEEARAKKLKEYKFGKLKT